jgi:CRP-like cAMP-binding protein
VAVPRGRCARGHWTIRDRDISELLLRFRVRASSFIVRRGSTEVGVDQGTPHGRLLRRLAAIVELGADEQRDIAQLPLAVRNLAPGAVVAAEGQEPTQCCLVLDGFLYRHKQAADSRRQIMSFHVPGDLPDLQTIHLERIDHTLSALGPAIIALIPHAALKQAMARSPALTHVFWRESLIDAASFREWVISLGQRDALARIAHIICEIALRLRAVGLARDFVFPAPWTQLDLADAAGISAVHTNRVVQELRRLDLLDWDSRQIRIHDWKGLQQAGDFRPDYLHLRPAVLADAGR